MAAENPISRYLSILPDTSEERILRLLIEVGIDITGSDEGSLLVLDDATQELVFAMTAGNRKSEEVLIGQRVPIGKSITGLAAMTREVQLGAPTFKDINQVHDTKTPDGNPTAVMAAPMLIDDEVIGVITAVSFDPAKRFGERESRLYAGFATIAGLVVQQRRKLSLAGPIHQTQPASAERKVLDSLQRILTAKPDAVSQAADLLAAIEKLVNVTGK